MDQVFVCYDGVNNTLSFEQNATLHNPIRFTFPTFLPDVTVSFNAGDGLGASTVVDNEIRSVTYAAPGQYQLWWAVSWISGYENDPLGNPVPIISAKTGLFTFQTNFNQDVNYNNFLPDQTWNEPTFVGQTYTPPAGNAYPAGSPFNAPVTADGIVQILYANPDHQMRKPFILVEGFDPIIENPLKYVVNNPQGQTLGYGRLRWDVIMTGRDESFDVDPNDPAVPHTPQFALLPSLIEQIQNRGYDIVYVDFADAGTYIQANAEFLIKVIERVNSEKITSEQNVLIGASMGGIVSRYALAKMESEGESHCTGLFGTFDTPHNGANIPLSLQALGWYYHAIGETDELWDALNAPAARQQNLLNLGAEIQAGRVTLFNEFVGIDPTCPLNITGLSFDELSDYDYATLRSTLDNDLNNVGWPQLPRKIALLNGMRNGTLASNQGFGPGQKFYDASIYADKWDFGTVFKIAMLSNSSTHDEEYTVHGMTNCSKWDCEIKADNTLFTIAQPHDFNPCLGGDAPYKYHIINLRCDADLPHTDNAPSGYRTDLSILHSRIKSVAEAQNETTFNNPVYFPVMAFVPTWSSLAMATPLNNTNLFVDLTSSEFFPENLPNQKVPNFDNFYAPTTNLRHVELDGGMLAFILSELDKLDAGPNEGLLTEEYNYGAQYKYIPNTTVTATGELNINNPGPTGYVQSAPGELAVKTVFTTYTQRKVVCEKPL
ncbi:MAG: hypothetical protein OHK0019_35620 [Saprospiraceae bacterium]